jgi:hypothetical protein
MCADWIVYSRCFLVDCHCDPGATRTRDNLLRRQALYPLSYRASASDLILGCDPGENRTLANSFEGCCSIR